MLSLFVRVQNVIASVLNPLISEKGQANIPGWLWFLVAVAIVVACAALIFGFEIDIGSKDK